MPAAGVSLTAPTSSPPSSASQRLLHDDNGVIVIMFTTFVTGNSDKVSHGKLLSSLDLDGFRLVARLIAPRSRA